MGIFSGSLNPQQQKAVEHNQGPLLIYAGAGSGKTMVISHSIAYLIEHHHVPSSSIMAVTFTNKAAKELAERVHNLVGPRSRNMLVSTFHSACVRFLRMYAEAIGFTNNFSIYDDTESKAVVKKIIKEGIVKGPEIDPEIILAKIDKLKNAGTTPEMYLSQIQNHLFDGDATSFRKFGEKEQHELFQKYYEVYQAHLKKQNAMDFGDLILETVKMLQNYPPILNALQNRFKYFLVDEFQDTNPVQFQLINLLSSQTGNLRVVGDDDQSIYSWRGAEPGFILEFKNHFPTAEIVYLEKNYRSTANIINAAAAVIANNRKRATKKLWTDAQNGDKIKLKVCANVHDEAFYIAQNVLLKIREGGLLRDIAILYRTNSQSRVLEDQMRKNMVPYVIYGSVRFYERAEIKVLLSYLKLLINPSDDVSFQKVIAIPRKGFGEKALEKLNALAIQKELSLLSTATRVAANEFTLEGVRGINGLKTFCSQFMEWLGMLQKNERPSNIFEIIINRINFRAYLESTYPEDYDERWFNVIELRNALIDYERKIEDEKTEPFNALALLSEFMQQAMLVVEPKPRDVASGATDAISLMTIHAAKGLEFDTVFIAGLDEGVLPHLRSIDDSVAIEEERRLMYVAMTRARKNLLLSRCREDIYRFERRFPSRFIAEIPLTCLDGAFVAEKREVKKIQTELTYEWED